MNFGLNLYVVEGDTKSVPETPLIFCRGFSNPQSVGLGDQALTLN
jgi:hypothetical protein